MIEIENPTELVHNLLKDYQIWIDNKCFYDKPRQPVIGVNAGGFHCYAYNDIESINKDSNSLIFIDLLTEGLHIRPYVEKYRKDRHYVLFSNGWWDIKTHVLPIRYDLVWYPWFLAEMIDTYCNSHRFCFWLDKTYRFEPKPFNFISTIGNVRPARDQLVRKLVEHELHVGSIIRYSGQNIGEPCNDDVIEIGSNNFDPYTPIVEPYFHNLSQTLPINIYNKGYFNLVVETCIDSTHEFMLTEKTIKSLITGMPFVMVSTPKFLNRLKALGFCTYDALWDESYDDIEDTHKRIDAVIGVCKKLAEFSWGDHMESLQNIALKNRSRFLECNEIYDTVFQNFEQTMERISNGNQA